MSALSSSQDLKLEIEDRDKHSDIESSTSYTTTLTASQYLKTRETASTSLEWPSIVAVFLMVSRADILALRSNVVISANAAGFDVSRSWMALSSALILSNKYVMDNLGFRFPITLTCWHLLFASLMIQIIAHTTTLLDNRRAVKMTRGTYLRVILPIGLLYSGSLVCSNLPYLTLSVAFIQMLKGLGPAAVLFATYTLGLDSPTWKAWLNILIIVLGVVAASFGEVRFVTSGFIYQMGGIFTEAYRLALIQKLLSSDEQKMDPLVSLYYYAPVCAAMIAVVALIGEVPSLQLNDVLEVGVWKLVANAGVAFLLNVTSVMLIGKTSSLVLMLCGTLKNILLVVASVLIWGTVVTHLQVFGYGITSVGLLYYSLGAKNIHRLFWRQEPFKEGQIPIGRYKRRSGRRIIALLMIGFAILAGACGGAIAGYNMEWDPRLYWYSTTRFSD